jgi:hypothetical protein
MADTAAPSPSLSDDELLQLVARERASAIGFEGDRELLAEREQALNYYKGHMPDVPALANRSKAVSTDVADAVETVLPDLIEIFTGGDDVAAFVPLNQADEPAARQETDYVNHVVFHKNDGFLTFYTAIKDALLEKLGVFMFWWEENIDIADERFENKNAAEVALAAQDGEILDLSADLSPEVRSTEGEARSAQAEASAKGNPSAEGGSAQTTYSFTLRQKTDKSDVKIMAVSPDDFAVAADTVSLKDTTYCAMRARPRAQDLLDRGIAREIVDALPPYGVREDASVETARDTAGEHVSRDANAGEPNDLRQVEVITHCIRLLSRETGKMEIWRVVTSADETKLIEKERLNRVMFATITPYPVTHRIYGRSLADLLIEVQRIKTALTRMVLDSGYFALNQRLEVSTDQAGEYTISDLLRNEPGVPIRSRTGNAVRPVSSGALAFDAFGALEYFSTVAESRTGIVRNAQGLNPDTLHDSATGALALMSAAQKRVRLIARIFAESGIKDLFLGVHALIRENCSAARFVRLNGAWTAVDPSSWAERNEMTIEVGLGASGRAHDLQMGTQASQILQQIVAGQGGAQGPIVTPANVYAMAKYIFGKLGIKAPERFLTDPSDPNAPQPPAPPTPPELLKVQLEHQRESQKNAADVANRSREIDTNAALKRAEIEGNLALKRYDIDARAKVDLANALARTSSAPHTPPLVSPSLPEPLPPVRFVPSNT